ncbi:tyrosine-type recombinase/integrase [Pedobacter sp. LMG 31464]|uniref:Tyrosine-type recombinase/integrase n=1 Tax=Pedobacter planticolens TaxID=2679964 RepID=A0A923IVA6_9SPHI|nr:site-specific integrase [Pedobacter planticolens]MBB2145816.1 tyrosine-type recombinase/integrase [Pedobacter planticolens]
MSQNYSLHFFLKKPKNYVDGEPRFIYMRITVLGTTPKEAPTGRKIDPKLWDSKSNSAIGRTEAIKNLNKYLETISSQFDQIHTEFKKEDLEINADTLMKKYLGKEEKPKKLLEVFFQHNADLETLIEKKKAKPNTLKGYKASVIHLTGYLEKIYRAEDIEIRKIDFTFITGYDFYLQTEKSLSKISVAKYMKHFKKIILLSIAHRYISYNPFSLYKVSAPPKKVIKLTKPEVARIAALDIKIDRLDRVRDIFLFSIYTGLSYADIKKLHRWEIEDGGDGRLWINTNREKNDNASNIPLMPTPLRLIEKYKDHPECIAKELVMPVLSNQKMNSYLKEIADLTGIKKKMTFHLARHTFGTTITLGNGVPIETVSKMMGHLDIRTTMHYAEVMEEKISQDMDSLREKLLKVV